MRVLVRSTAEAAALAGWSVRRTWLQGHEFVRFQPTEDEVMEAALVDQRLWVDFPGQVVHSVVAISAVDFELHAVCGLCTSASCPTGTPLASITPVTVGGAW